MRPFDGRRVLLGISGGIASYKSAWLARLLTLAGASVDVVMTRAATEFIGPVTLEALTGRVAYHDLFASGRALAHIRLAREAELVIVAPATADLLARTASGMADDLLTTTLLATSAPVLLVAAMNDHMWAHPQTGRNVAHLRQLGYRVLDPDVGPLAEGPSAAPGRMPEPETIMAYAARLLEAPSLASRRVVVTAGPTREPLDPVRFISNRSTGKMGVAIASAAWRRGADVTLIAGPLETPPPPDISLVSVETTDQMAAAVQSAVADADVLVMAAAPADVRPAHPAGRKLAKRELPTTLDLALTTDILRTTRAHRREGQIVVGFALETGAAGAADKARAKMHDKALDIIVLNDATEPGAGFGVDTNRVTILRRDGDAVELPLLSKHAVADAILDDVEGLLRAR
ncbi:MAG TPA: bifunctional phosphopantothenoylcysteine decarboxylase/phosphopantothenate--cysteine ligase CoaBC [Gemmatimonadaceae bacterium]|nr:bifunctional phosphopantothenoylcysteine decarboxylase/phosphopantothenate--cysteine ligase CoaBC [Gemmatimonadaceae bacterium]